jgi:hypothetical protein
MQIFAHGLGGIEWAVNHPLKFVYKELLDDKNLKKYFLHLKSPRDGFSVERGNYTFLFLS